MVAGFYEEGFVSPTPACRNHRDLRMLYTALHCCRITEICACSIRHYTAVASQRSAHALYGTTLLHTSEDCCSITFRGQCILYTALHGLQRHNHRSVHAIYGTNGLHNHSPAHALLFTQATWITDQACS
ncbi:hypothetical protein J6590_043806 [Homalodisca vitripennis]|nr:hypothetical protein J6590_043806 [Homalodisca vitripennis]